MHLKLKYHKYVYHMKKSYIKYYTCKCCEKVFDDNFYADIRGRANHPDDYVLADEDEGEEGYQLVKYKYYGDETIHQLIGDEVLAKQMLENPCDVIYHLLVTLESAGINFDDIIKELKKREETSGFEEKKNR